jgi:hypothetical protein
MSAVVIAGDTSGSITLDAPAVAGTTVLTLPATTGTVFVGGQALTATTGSFSGNLSFNSGYGSAAVAYGCRAWVNFNGTGTVAIRASGNVTSITDNNTGNYSVNLTSAMPDTNYSCVGLCGTAGVTQGLFVNQSSTASVANVFTVNTGGTLTDYQQVMLNIHR